MNSLQSILRQEIESAGQITFARFMAQALYCPDFGYYEQLKVSPGRKADFFTSVSVGDLFGELLARQITEWLANFSGDKIQILEAGAHNGSLAKDILTWLERQQPELFGRIEYWLLEPSAKRTAAQQENLRPWNGKVRWFSSWPNLPDGGVNGIILSNELLDALPLHRVSWNADAQDWFEWGVMAEGENFAWKKLSPEISAAQDAGFAAALKLLRELPRDLQSILPDGFSTEICPAATAWWEAAAGHLRKGWLMTIDYGLLAEEFFMPHRQAGTVRAYYKHQQQNDLLARPGQQDLTAHVNFSNLTDAGETSGLKTEVLTSQSQFLTGIMARAFKESPAFGQHLAKRSGQLQTLTHPEHLGRSFRVLVQSR